MAPPERRRARGHAGAVHSRNTSGRTYSVREKAGRKHRPPDVFDFPDNSEISSSASEGKKDTEPYETFDPPLHSTAIYADEEELSRHCGSSVHSTPQGETARGSVNTSENKASENESVQISTKKPGRKRKPISDDSESCETSEIRRKVSLREKKSVRQHGASPTGMPSGTPGTPAKSAPPKRRGDLRGRASPERDTLATLRPQKARRKNVSQGKRRKPRRDTSGADISDSMHIWCLEGKKSSDIMELDIVLSAFEKTILEYKERIESKICKEAINKFHLNIKEELVKMLKEAQMWKNLKRKNAKVISDIEKKRQRLIEVQDEVLRLEPQLKQLQTKYDELKERKASLRDAANFLTNLKQLYQDYSDVQEKEPNIKETYNSSSLPAMLFKARSFLGAENHLQNINHQLERLLDLE
ncbi:centromere protein U isoform X1 [Ochotona princeps]|uniref:centromere protein U isoform X1 n=1 Tax=Ochotona princeps TaxID=9978 RepID=UPI0027152713|nr:centromere protein U isoform X1 [Ochotona princeps]